MTMKVEYDGVIKAIQIKHDRVIKYDGVIIAIKVKHDRVIIALSEGA